MKFKRIVPAMVFLMLASSANAQKGITWDNITVVVKDGEPWNITASAESTPVWKNHDTGVTLFRDNVQVGLDSRAGNAASVSYTLDEPGKYLLKATCAWSNSNPKVCKVRAEKVPLAK